MTELFLQPLKNWLISSLVCCINTKDKVLKLSYNTEKQYNTKICRKAEVPRKQYDLAAQCCQTMRFYTDGKLVGCCLIFFWSAGHMHVNSFCNIFVHESMQYFTVCIVGRRLQKIHTHHCTSCLCADSYHLNELFVLCHKTENKPTETSKNAWAKQTYLSQENLVWQVLSHQYVGITSDCWQSAHALTVILYSNDVTDLVICALFLMIWNISSYYTVKRFSQEYLANTQYTIPP